MDSKDKSDLAGTKSEEAVESIRRSAGEQFLEMANWTADQKCRDSLRSISDCVDDHLTTISKLVQSGQIRPFTRTVLAESDAPVPVEVRPLRLGIYPLAANPMHWGHILVGLNAMVAMKLDKVVLVIAGADRRKPSMAPAETRHRLARSAIETFSPLFEYSPLALHTGLDGETNCGRLLKLNAGRPLEAFYIAGWDHYRRTTPEGAEDTIAKLERIVTSQVNAVDNQQRLSAVFVARGGTSLEQNDILTFLRVYFLPPIPLAFSSTTARRALCKDANCSALVFLPYSCLSQIQKDGLYTSRGECVEELERTS